MIRLVFSARVENVTWEWHAVSCTLQPCWALLINDSVVVKVLHSLLLLYSCLPWYEVFYPLLDNISDQLSSSSSVTPFLDALHLTKSFKPGETVVVAVPSSNKVSKVVITWSECLLSGDGRMSVLLVFYGWNVFWNCLLSWNCLWPCCYSSCHRSCYKRVVVIKRLS